ncbi:hypothetical protein GSI_03784 [Ganoderma sinense ZZ0214-1]|uniref:Uncharacterized protein n=1 Tax=Ganoderma sinense ZZ0214-1 TaxID=1077348 RepID=A0A2G8SJY7_9APHY|nr:hypothetical protein GSI_03784 [Ganoderma sinense ZZ0214-1]
MSKTSHRCSHNTTNANYDYLNRTGVEQHLRSTKNVGWGNAFQELLLNAYLTYKSGRTFVFANYTWNDDGSPYTVSFNRTIPSQIPYTALIRGPIVGEPWGPRYEHVPAAVTRTYFEHICPSKSELTQEQVHSSIPYASNTETIIDTWSKAINNVTDPCLQMQKSSGQIFDHWETFGVPGNLASIWPDLIATPLLTHFTWSPLIELAFDVNRDLFLPQSSLANTPYLSSLPYDSSAPTATTTNAARYPLIPGLMAIHIRQGDYSSHCTTLGSIGDPFVSVNSFPSLPDQLMPPGNRTSHGKLPVEWTGSPEQLEYHHRRCFPSIPEIVAKVLEVRSAPVGAGVRRIHIMTNGKAPYIAQLKNALKDAAEWDSVSSSRDLVLNWEQKFVSQAVDVLVAQRAQVIIGNGFSTLTSNAVIMRLANNFSTDSIRFF